MPASGVDDLVAVLEVGPIAGAQGEVDGVARPQGGALSKGGWGEGMKAVSDALVRSADCDGERRCGRSDGAAELAVHLTDVGSGSVPGWNALRSSSGRRCWRVPDFTPWSGAGSWGC